MRTRDVMSSPAITVTPDIHIKQVAALLVERGVSAIPVVDEKGLLVGIVSEADLVPLEAAPDPRAHAAPVGEARERIPTTVAEIMTRDVVALPEDADAAEAARLMLERHVKRIPIVRGGRVVGIVSRRDLLRVLARSDQEIGEELRRLLEDDLLMLGHFRAEVSDGLVTLTRTGTGVDWPRCSRGASRAFSE